MLSRMETRNRDIFEAFHNERTCEELAKEYELSPKTIRQIIDRERQKRAVSPDGYYRALRLAEARAQIRAHKLGT